MWEWHCHKVSLVVCCNDLIRLDKKLWNLTILIFSFSKTSVKQKILCNILLQTSQLTICYWVGHPHREMQPCWDLLWNEVYISIPFLFKLTRCSMLFMCLTCCPAHQLCAGCRCFHQCTFSRATCGELLKCKVAYLEESQALAWLTMTCSYIPVRRGTRLDEFKTVKTRTDSLFLPPMKTIDWCWNLIDVALTIQSLPFCFTTGNHL